MIFEHHSPSNYLRAILSERLAERPAYSLRAMARQLDLHPSMLSMVLSQKKRLSAERAVVIAQKLSLKGEAAEYFQLLVQLDSAQHPDLKDSLMTRMRQLRTRYLSAQANAAIEVRDLSVDLFKIIADWYHLPILELTQIKGFVMTPKKIAKKLGITPFEAQTALERLLRLELLERLETSGTPGTPGSKDQYKKTHENIHFKSEIPNPALRRFHKQVLERSLASIEQQDPQTRYLGTQVFAIDTEDLPKARKLIDQFRQKLVRHFNQGKNPTEVYGLGIQLFNLNASSEKKENNKNEN